MFLKSFACLIVLALPLIAQGQDLKDVKCLVNPKAAAKAGMSAKHLDGDVYFCCNGCKSKYEANPEKFAAAANYQLVSSGQYQQKACPISGGAVSKGQSIKVNGVQVDFCCGNCKAKAAAAKDATGQIDLLFAKTAFNKGFEPAKAEDIDLSKARCPMMDDEVSAEYVADYNGGKVFFCCKRCVASFEKNPEKYAAAANAQMVATGQFKQTGCPFSGGALAANTAVKVGGEEISFCCKNCKAKVEGAASDAERMTMVFSDNAFGKGFASAKTEK